MKFPIMIEQDTFQHCVTQAFIDEIEISAIIAFPNDFIRNQLEDVQDPVRVQAFELELPYVLSGVSGI